MKSSRKDTYGNTALHYAKSYPDQSIVKFLLSHGAKIDVNPQKMVNVHHRTLEEYFYEKCILVEGDDIDDEVFLVSLKEFYFIWWLQMAFIFNNIFYGVCSESAK